MIAFISLSSMIAFISSNAPSIYPTRIGHPRSPKSGLAPLVWRIVFDFRSKIEAETSQDEASVVHIGARRRLALDHVRSEAEFTRRHHQQVIKRDDPRESAVIGDR